MTQTQPPCTEHIKITDILNLNLREKQWMHQKSRYKGKTIVVHLFG